MLHSGLNYQTPKGNTGLHLAVIKGDKLLVKKILKLKVDVELSPATTGNSPLMDAALNDFIDVHVSTWRTIVS